MKRNKLLSMLLALAVSVGLWLYVVTVVDPNDTKTVYGVPVTFDNIEYLKENNLIMTSGQNTTVTLKFYGRRSELKNLTSSTVTATADASRINNEGEQSLSYNIALPDSVSGGSVELMEKSPTRLTVIVERAVEKEIPVEVDIVNEVAEGYVADLENMTVTPNTLTIFGPANEVERVEVARVSLDIGEVTQTLDSSYPYTLLDGENNEVSDSELHCSDEAVSLVLPVKKYKEVPLKLTIVEGGGAREENVSITLSPEYITVAGPASVVDEMEYLNLGTLDLAELTAKNKTLTFDLTMPNGVTNVSGETQAIAQITLSGLAEKTLDISAFTLYNEPDNLAVTVKTTLLQILIRGPVEEIPEVEAEDLVVSVDLADFKQAGTYSIPVEINSHKFPQVGIVGSASITITIE